MSIDLPYVFVDRSLGAHIVPGLLRAAGVVLTTMAEHYGEHPGQRLTDENWIAETARLGWLGFHKDDHIRRNLAEKQAVRDSGARLFCVPNANLRAADLAQRYIDNLPAIARAAAGAGPYIYSVYAERIVRIELG